MSFLVSYHNYDMLLDIIRSLSKQLYNYRWFNHRISNTVIPGNVVVVEVSSHWWCDGDTMDGVGCAMVGVWQRRRWCGKVNGLGVEKEVVGDERSTENDVMSREWSLETTPSVVNHRCKMSQMIWVGIEVGQIFWLKERKKKTKLKFIDYNISLPLIACNNTWCMALVHAEYGRIRHFLLTLFVKYFEV